MSRYCVLFTVFSFFYLTDKKEKAAALFRLSRDFIFYFFIFFYGKEKNSRGVDLSDDLHFICDSFRCCFFFSLIFFYFYYYFKVYTSESKLTRGRRRKIGGQRHFPSCHIFSALIYIFKFFYFFLSSFSFLVSYRFTCFFCEFFFPL